jgi:hypothetical protein
MEKCFWCGNATPKTKNGWVQYPLRSIGTAILFCSKKCLAAASVKGQGKCLDANKIAAKQRRHQQKEKAEIMSDLMRKEKLGNEDLAVMTQCLSAKQKKVLAIVGLANMSWAVHGNPKQLMVNIHKMMMEFSHGKK